MGWRRERMKEGRGEKGEGDGGRKGARREKGWGRREGAGDRRRKEEKGG